MSDYLWDKTGEPDAETERLEELLGQLRFQPTPFDLPAGLPAKEPRPARTGNILPARNVLSWPRLAVAASVTLAVLAGAWLVLKQQTGATNDKPQVAAQSNQPGAGEKQSTAALTKSNENNANDTAAGNNAGGEKKANGSDAAAPPQRNEKRREERVAFPHRPRVPDIRSRAPRANRDELVRAPKRRENLTPPDASARHEERASITDAEREAAEKVLYALRITSEKLNYARRQVRGSGRDEANR